MDSPIDYIFLYNSHKSFKKLCEIYDVEFIIELIFAEENKLLEKILQ